MATTDTTITLPMTPREAQYVAYAIREALVNRRIENAMGNSLLDRLLPLLPKQEAGR